MYTPHDMLKVAAQTTGCHSDLAPRSYQWGLRGCQCVWGRGGPGMLAVEQVGVFLKSEFTSVSASRILVKL